MKNLQALIKTSKHARRSQPLRAAIKRAIAKSPRDQADSVSLWLTLLPPSVNGLYANKSTGGRIATKEYRAWLDAGVSELRSIQRAPLIPGPVRIGYLLVRPNAASDLGNRLKALDDLLVEANVIEDDRHIEAYDRFEWIPFGSAAVFIEVRKAAPVVGAA